MKLENASTLDAFRLCRYGPAAVYYRDADLVNASPLEAFFRVIDAYSGEWQEGTYVRAAIAAGALGRLNIVTATQLQPALGAAVRAFICVVNDATGVDANTPAWAVADVLAAQTDSHARALALHINSLSRRGANREFLLDCICFSLATWALACGHDEALLEALTTIHEQLTKEGNTNATAAAA